MKRIIATLVVMTCILSLSVNVLASTDVSKLSPPPKQENLNELLSGIDFSTMQVGDSVELADGSIIVYEGESATSNGLLKAVRCCEAPRQINLTRKTHYPQTGAGYCDVWVQPIKYCETCGYEEDRSGGYWTTQVCYTHT